MRPNSKIRFCITAAITLFAWQTFIADSARAQIRSGSAFLKIPPGARFQGMGNSLTGAIDEVYALYANPAATGFFREWQWSATYTEWFADIYSLSVNYGRQVRTPWSRSTRLAFGLHYQGVRDFESTAGAHPSTSANDLLLTASIGNPLSFISSNLSLGANVKYLRSHLDDFTASTVIFDSGLLYRSERFKINSGLFDYGVISAGVAVTQLGSSLNFISQNTPLPTTLRAGAAIQIGSHNGLQIQLAGDYHKVRDEISRFSLGTEVAWSYNLALRGGYNFNSNILSKFSFGLSLRLDDHASPIKHAIPGRNNALRLDLAGLEDNDFFSTVYQGGVNLYPIGPEKFDIIDLGPEACADNGSPQLSWQASRDPDIFDDVHYLLLVVKEDSLAMSQLASNANEKPILQLIELGPPNHLDSTQIDFRFLQTLRQPLQNGHGLYKITDRLHFAVNQTASYHVSKKQKQFSHRMPPVQEPGDYFWTVAAYDRDEHLRFADCIGRFRVPTPNQPDLQITRIDFHLQPKNHLVNDGDACEGEIEVTLSNHSKCPAKNFTLNVYDSLRVDPRLLTIRSPDEIPRTPLLQSIYHAVIDEIPAGGEHTLLLPWRRAPESTDHIVAYVDEENLVAELDEENNVKGYAIRLPELEVNIRSEPSMARTGEIVSYSLKIENHGTASARNFVVNNYIPEFVTVIDSSYSVYPDSAFEHSVSWWVNTLAPTEVWNVSYRVVVNSTMPDLKSIGKISNVCDILPTNNTDSTVVEGVEYDLQLTKTAIVEPLRPAIQFNLNDSTLTEASRHQLDTLGRALVSPELQNTFIKIEGHTDLQGFRGYTKAQSMRLNQKLSEGRARSVRHHLEQHFNISPERICDVGYGQTRPISNLHHVNRRVEITILDSRVQCDSSNINKKLIVNAVYPGATIGYHLKLTNSGPALAQNIIVEDELPPLVKIIPGSISKEPTMGSNGNVKLLWQIDALAPAQSTEISYKVKVDSLPPNRDAYPLVNQSRVEARFDRNEHNNSSSNKVLILAGKPKPGDQPSQNGQANSKNSKKETSTLKTPRTNGGIPSENSSPTKPVHERRLPRLNPEDLKKPATQ